MFSREEIKQLSNDELKAQLKLAKISCGPITTTTRRIYEGRLNAHFEIQRNNKTKEANDKNQHNECKNETNLEPSLSMTTKPEALITEPVQESNPLIKQNKQRVDEKNEQNTKSTDKVVKFEANHWRSGDLISSSSMDENHFAVSKTSDKKNLKVDLAKTNGHDQIDTAKPDKPEEIGDGFFYGVWVPNLPTRIKVKNKPRVYFSKKSALEAVKKYNGSRFKQFKTKEEAEKFSLTSSSNVLNVEVVLSMVTNNNNNASNNSSSSNNMESLSASKIEAFKAPTVQEVQKFRKFIEDGDMYNFQKCINNPKYLVNSKDFPVVVHEGMRSNALHVAIKYDRMNMCSFIMDRVTSMETYTDLYPEASLESLQFRKNHVEKLYLNTPEKIVSFYHIPKFSLFSVFVRI